MSRYRLTGRLETGELSELFAAVRDDEAVVVKLFHPETSDVRYAQELAETARQLSAVRGPGIVRIVDIGLVRDRLAVVRPAVEGVTLGQVLSQLSTKDLVLAPPLALWIAVQLLEAVQQAHQAGAVHGALTPGNVLLTTLGEPAIFDFGALKALYAVPGLRKSFGARGRDAYRAPEVAKGNSPSVESDLYSVGAIAYELLTLREPVPPKSAGAVSTRAAAPPPPSRLDRRLNARLDPILLRALELQEGRRYRSASEFAGALRSFLANDGGLPKDDELLRFIDSLHGHDQTMSLGPVPFSDAFTLNEVKGADLPPVTEKHEVVQLRPSFSGPFSGSLLDTDPQISTAEAAPAFEEYRGPKPDEGTDPGHAGPLEKGWEAPTGAAPPRPRSPKNGVLASRPVLRNPRVKLVEDFSSPPTEAGTPVDGPTRRAEPALLKPEPTPSALPTPLPIPAVPPPPAGPKGLLPPPPVDLKAIEITGPLESSSLPADTNQQVPRPMSTAERFLMMDSRKRRRMLLLALAVAFVGAFSFALAIRRLGSRGIATPGTKAQVHAADEPRSAPAGETYDPAFRTVNGALKKYFKTEDGAPPEEKEPAPQPAPQPAPAEVQAKKPAARERSAFLTVSADVPAVVYIDDVRVKRRPPLYRYPVQPGVHVVVVEASLTGERYKKEVVVEQGQVKKIEERFRPGR